MEPALPGAIRSAGWPGEGFSGFFPGLVYSVRAGGGDARQAQSTARARRPQRRFQARGLYLCGHSARLGFGRQSYSDLLRDRRLKPCRLDNARRLGLVRRLWDMAYLHCARAICAPTLAASNHRLEPAPGRRCPRSADWPLCAHRRAFWGHPDIVEFFQFTSTEVAWLASFGACLAKSESAAWNARCRRYVLRNGARERDRRIGRLVRAPDTLDLISQGVVGRRRILVLHHRRWRPPRPREYFAVRPASFHRLHHCRTDSSAMAF